MSKLIQPVVSIPCIIGLMFSLPLQAEEYENADYAGLPIVESVGAYLPTAHKMGADFSSVEISQETSGCELIEDHYDYTGTEVTGCRDIGPTQELEWSYLY